MQASTSSSTSSPAPLIGIVAGVVIAIGAFLPWAKETALGNSETAAGFDGWEGKVCLIAGVGIAIRSFVAMRQGRTRQIAAAVLIGGIIATGVAAYTAVTAKDQFHDALVSELVSQGIVPDEATASTAVQAAIDGGQVTVSISFGLYVVIFGGIAAMAAGAMALTAGPVSTPSAGVPAGPADPSAGFGAPAGGFDSQPPPTPSAPAAPAPGETLPPPEPSPPEGPPTSMP
jgi:hypothetical protein